MKRLYLILIISAGVLLIIGFFIALRIGGEDSWIKNEKGVWIKHGNPSETPAYVLEQQEAVNCAFEMFDNFNEEKSSQCLGACGDYAVDSVNALRTEEDNLVENQCEDYRNGNVGHFIELDKNREVVRIV